MKNRKTSVEKAKKNGYIYIVRRNLEIYLRLGDNVNVIRRIGARMNSKVTWVIEKCAGNGFFAALGGDDSLWLVCCVCVLIVARGMLSNNTKIIGVIVQLEVSSSLSFIHSFMHSFFHSFIHS